MLHVHCRTGFCSQLIHTHCQETILKILYQFNLLAHTHTHICTHDCICTKHRLYLWSELLYVCSTSHVAQRGVCECQHIALYTILLYACPRAYLQYNHCTNVRDAVMCAYTAVGITIHTYVHKTGALTKFTDG